MAQLVAQACFVAPYTACKAGDTGVMNMLASVGVGSLLFHQSINTGIYYIHVFHIIMVSLDVGNKWFICWWWGTRQSRDMRWSGILLE